MTDTFGDSPTRPKHTHSIEYRSAYVENSRNTLLHDIPIVSEVYLDSLMDVVLHHVSPGGLDSVYKKLVSSGCIKDPDSDHPRWRCLPRDPSAEGSDREDVVFKFLETITEDITRHSKMQTYNRKLKVVGFTPPAGNRHNRSRPDGFIDIGTTGSTTVNWADIVMPMEFKNKDDKSSRADDFAKVMWSMHHTMRNDPRRRFVHGFTCENTRARLWYNDRCDVVVSEEFDINKDWKYLVRIILSILMAPRADLGYDSDIQLISTNDRNSEPSYDITIRNPDTGKATVYRTIRIISDVGADSMVGRGTRVWEVRKFENGYLEGPPYALKDVWVYADRGPEHVVLQKIRTEQPNYSQYFLTPIDYGFASLNATKSSTFDSTHNPLGRGRNLRPTGKVQILHMGPTSGKNTTDSRSQKSSIHSRSSVGHSVDIPDSPSKGYRDFGRLSKHSRLHYRIAFVEIGEPVHNLRNFTDVFTAIQGGWEGLHAIHLCAYVHRDVSSGNILLVPPSGTWLKRGVIMDLEYTKSIDDISAPHDVKTGTAAFMATEVANMSHHRLLKLRGSAVPQYDSLEAVKKLLDSVVTGDEELVSRPNPLPLPPFRHNPLHDMESTWWLCLWMMFLLVPTSEKNDQTQLEGYHTIFRNQALKENLLCTPGSLPRFAPHLWKHPIFANVMDKWATALNTYYSIAYRQHDSSMQAIRIDDKTVEECYEAGQKCLGRLKDGSKTLLDCVILSEPPKNQEAVSTVTVQPIPRLIFDGVIIEVPRSKMPQSK